jgi:hypothetical protein
LRVKKQIHAVGAGAESDFGDEQHRLAFDQATIRKRNATAAHKNVEAPLFAGKWLANEYLLGVVVEEREARVGAEVAALRPHQ